MQEQGAELELRDIAIDRLSVTELDKLIGNQDYKSFLNTRNELYRERNMGEHPPSRSEALKLLSENPNLIRRPIVIRCKKMVLGFDEKALTNLL